MKILVDRHHHALLESYMLTLEDRLGWEVYCPYGMEWFDNEVWNFERAWHGDKVAHQYLKGIWGDPVDWVDERDWGIIVDDSRHLDRTLRGIRYDAALDMDWDIVLSSLPHNDEGYHRLAQKTGAVFGVQVGNAVQQSRWDLAEFILSSSTLPGHGPEQIGKRFIYAGTPAVMYHQEFDLNTFRFEWPPAEQRTIASFVNCFCEMEAPYAQFSELASRYGDEFDWKVYGSYGKCAPDELAAGDISWVPSVAQKMRDTRIGWHAKSWSDGYGFVIHQWFAVGRPVLGWARYYADKIAAPLWVDGVTSYDMERPLEDIIAILRRLRDDEEFHWRISANAARRFREVVDFDAEAEVVYDLLSDALS